MFLIGVYIGLLAFLIVLIVFLVVDSSKKKDLRIRHNEVNSLGLEQLEKLKFKISKMYYIDDHASFRGEKNEKQIVCVDEENKKLAMFDYEKGNVNIFNFGEIISYEIYENDSQVTSGGKVGGFGAFFASETTGNCKELKLIIRVDKIEKPQFVYDIISDTILNFGISKSSEEYKKCISTMQEFISLLELIKNKNSK